MNKKQTFCISVCICYELKLMIDEKFISTKACIKTIKQGNFFNNVF